MNEETTKLLHQLAEKMGTTSEHLWRVLVRQAPWSAAITLFEWFLLWGCLYACVRWFKWSIEKYKEDDNYAISGLASGVCGVVLGLIIVISALEYGELVFAGFFNPEYWALTTVLHLIHLS